MFKNLKSRILDQEFTTECYTNRVFIFSLGYEQRSYYLFNRIQDFILKPKNTIICFVFDDYKKNKSTLQEYQKLEKLGIKIVEANYNEEDTILTNVNTILSEIIANTNNPIDVHVDYSSMPRRWYSRLPILLSNLLRNTDAAYFWYVQGDYKTDISKNKKDDGFPSAGVDEFEVFSGRASIRANNKRTHLLGLGYDNIRSKAILSVVDPSYLVVCYAFPTGDPNIGQKVKVKNEEIFNLSSLSFSLPLNDFNFTVSKLCEITHELLDKGDLILIPDGPKPLILACSLVPHIVQKIGVVCFHVKRHKSFFKPVEVIPIPNGEIFGFSFNGSK